MSLSLCGVPLGVAVAVEISSPIIDEPGAVVVQVVPAEIDRVGVDGRIVIVAVFRDQKVIAIEVIVDGRGIAIVVDAIVGGLLGAVVDERIRVITVFPSQEAIAVQIVVGRLRIAVVVNTIGMGKGVAKVLAARDNQRHEIILLGRSQERGEATLREIQGATHNPKLSFVCCDLTRLSDVKKAIAEIRAKNDTLDGIFINAGLGYAAAREETEDGMVAHFQVNYLSQFMLTLGLLDRLERSESGGRVIFNVTEGGHLSWDDLQMKQKWGYEDAIHQAMVAKRMFYRRLHTLSREAGRTGTSFYGFQIQKTVWSNQINIIPAPMRMMATIVKWFGGFISIEACGEIMAPLFTEDQASSLGRSGKFITANEQGFLEKEEDKAVLDPVLQDKLWDLSLDLCKDDDTRRISNDLRPAR